MKNGLFLVVLGPDGAGKSTLTDYLLSSVRQNFSKVYRFHWRPGVLPQLSQSNSASKNKGSLSVGPPENYAYGFVISLIRFLYYYLDFIIGYWFRIYPMRKRGELVLGERWYYDVIINPERYGFKIPFWLRSMAGKLLPKPDITILLTGDPEVIYARKKELDPVSIKKQLIELEKLINNIPSSAIVSTDLPFDETCREIDQVFLNLQNKNENNNWIAFPSGSDTRLCVSRLDIQRNVSYLYAPYSNLGVLSKLMLLHLPLRIWQKCSFKRFNDIYPMLLIVRRVLNRQDVNINLSIGTPGPHQKYTLQVFHQNEIIAYVKVSTTKLAHQQLERENKALKSVNNMKFPISDMPSVIACICESNQTYLFITPPNETSLERRTDLVDKDILFLEQLSSAGVEELKINTAINKCNLDKNETNEHILRAIQEVKTIADEFQILSVQAHGDYVPWNTRLLSSGNLYVFDWEYYDEHAPLYLDIFHRTFMPDRLLKHMSASSSCNNLFSLWKNPLLYDYMGDESQNQKKLYILLYLLRMHGRRCDNGKMTDHYILDAIKYVLEK